MLARRGIPRNGFLFVGKKKIGRIFDAVGRVEFDGIERRDDGTRQWGNIVVLDESHVVEYADKLAEFLSTSVEFIMEWLPYSETELLKKHEIEFFRALQRARRKQETKIETMKTQ